MDLKELQTCYYIDPNKIKQLDQLGLLNNIPKQNHHYQFNYEDIQYVLEMIHLLDIGLTSFQLVQYYKYPSSQKELLNNTRLTLLEEIHTLQKKLDQVDYMLYVKDK